MALFFVTEVYDVTTIYKFYVPHYNSSYEDYTGQGMCNLLQTVEHATVFKEINNLCSVSRLFVIFFVILVCDL